MNYTLHQLQIFLQVAKEKSITRAAEAMHMTQPALSIQLKNFQMQFDIPLTEIIGKRLYITDFGKSIAEIAENILRESDAIKYKTREYSGLVVGRFKISSVSTGKYVMPYFLSGFMKAHPGIDLILDVSNKATVVKNLNENETDFALVSVLPKEVVVNEEILLENRLYLVSNSPKTDRKKPLIYRESGSATRMAMDDYYSHRAERKSMTLTSNEAVKQAVISGLGDSILPLIGIRNELSNQELHIIPARGLPIVTNWRLIWNKNKKLSPVAAAYLNYVKTAKDDIIHNQFKWYLEYIDSSLRPKKGGN